MTGTGDAATDAPSTAWAALGDAGGPVLESATVLRIELPFVAPVATAVGTHRTRPLLFVRLRCRSDDGRSVEGWGECAALADTTYDAEDVDGATGALAATLLPALWSCVADLGGRLPPMGVLAATPVGPPGGHGAGPLATAALEMAVADAHLRSAGRSFADLLGVDGASVTPGAVLGLVDDPDDLATAAERLARAGYARIKAKVAPGREFATVSALAGWADGRDGAAPVLQVDANGAYRPDQADLLTRLDGFGLACIEQPFGADDLASHRALARRMTTPICLDESLDGPGRVVEAVDGGACSVVCVKPARLGGIGPALEVVEWCRAAGVAWWIGGMFESGYGRRVTTAMAALAGPTLPGDLALPATYLAADVVPEASTWTDADTGLLAVRVSDEPGMGPAPDLTAVGVRWTVSAEIPAPGA